MPSLPMAWASRVIRCRAFVIQAVGRDEGTGDVPVEEGIVGEIEHLLAAFAEEADCLVAAVHEGRRPGGSKGKLPSTSSASSRSRSIRRWRRSLATAPP